MTDDFVNDALDSLEKDGELVYFFVGAHRGAKSHHRASRIKTRDDFDYVSKIIINSLTHIDTRLKSQGL